ncbi:MAG: mannose-6-phosphate isomerase, class I, partial [bacterium]
AQAEIGFARENSLGIPLSAPHRNYKDDNHKPEVHVALTDFWMLHGFRPLPEIAGMLTFIPEFENVMPDFSPRMERACENETQQQQLLKNLYTKIMTMPQTNVDSILAPLIERITPQYLNGKLTKGTPDFWAARAATQFFPREGRYDRGIFSIYLLNLVHLRQGEGTFQDAGMLHAYLEGQNVELMANSDNVLRGGLTSKHIDIPELLQTVTFTGAKPEILSGDSHAYNERIFRTPAKDFQLSRIDLYPRNSFESKPGHGLDVFFVLLGSASLQAPGKAAMFSKGKAFLVPAAFEYSIQAKENTVLFRATLPA